MAMLEALVSGEREAQILAAREIGKLDKKQKQKLSDNIGVVMISSLVMMLHQQQDYESVEASLSALLNLAFGSERNKHRMVKCGAIPAILKIIRCENESLLELSVAALLILSSCSANKQEIASCGAIQLLLELLNSNSPSFQSVSHQTKFDIISTLHNLSTCSQIIPLIILSDGLVVLVRLIYDSDKSSELVEKAMALVESMVSSSNAALDQVSEMAGAIGMLVEAIEEGSSICQELAVSILATICKSCRERYRGMILKEGAVPGLLQLSVDGTWRARENAKALLLLLRDCEDNIGSASTSSEKVKHNNKKVVKLREVMRQIDRWEMIGHNGTSVQVVEEMISKLRT